MKIVKIAGLVALLVAGSAMAIPTATWTVNSPSAGTVVGAGGIVAWDASVAITTDCKGLATYAITLLLQKDGAPFAYTFPKAVFGQVKTNAGYTGPSWLGGTTTPGKLAGISAGYGAPWAGPPTAIWGVGLAARKAELGVAPTGQFVLNSGAIDTTGFAQGTYTVKLQVDSSTVLRTYKGTTTTIINWETAMTSLATESATLVGSQFTFVVPEPATMMLLAGAGLLIRRRQA